MHRLLIAKSFSQAPTTSDNKKLQVHKKLSETQNHCVCVYHLILLGKEATV